MRPKVSIVVPVYNAEKYLHQCLESIRKQTLHEIEIICIDDASSDDSALILDGYADQDYRMHVYHNSENCGVSVSRNRGIILATGEYVGFVDSDDSIESDFYARLYIAAQSVSADISKGRFNTIAGKYNFLSAMNDEIKLSRARFFGEFYTAIYRSDFLAHFNIRFPEDQRTLEDNIFSVEAGLAARRIVFDDAALYHYIRRKGSKSRMVNRLFLEHRFMGARRVLDLMHENEDWLAALHEMVLSNYFLTYRNIDNDIDRSFARAEMEKILSTRSEIVTERCIDVLYRQWKEKQISGMIKKIRQTSGNY